MKTTFLSIRPFIGAKNFAESRSFYRHLGFDEIVLAPNFSNFNKQGFTFYLQDAYVEDWVNNTMVFMEVENVEECWEEMLGLDLVEKYPTAKLTPISHLDWGSECFLHDPSGILWHFGQFNK
ncbi:MAG: glyoxalase [Chitinophagaceae bacterium]|nr:MAG: glyoxalase [Chitinophagaceae bacterium]